MKYVGIIVTNNVFRGIPRGRTGNEMLKFYEEGGRKYGLKPCYFRLTDIVPGIRTIVAYVKGKSGYSLQRIPIPKVIHNRALHNKSSVYKMKYLANKGIIVFNGYRGKINKMTVHRLLWQNTTIRKHLPTSVSGTAPNLLKMMKRHSSLLIKPKRGSLGKGIRRLQKSGSSWKLNLSKNNSLTFKSQIPQSLLKRLRSNAYFIQQRVPLAKYKGSPFDIRVSVQKNLSGKWGVTGMVTKVAAKGHYVSNVYQGGRVYQLQQVLRNANLNSARVQNSVKRLSLAVAKQLGKSIPYLADLGLDIGITNKGFPFFIESNRREQRYSFREGGLYHIWRNTHVNPIGYAKYLLLKKTSRKRR